MKFVRVTCEQTTCEGCFLGEDEEGSVKRFLKDHPSLNGLKTKTQIIDDKDEKWQDYFRVQRANGWSIWYPD